jgi:hypothetical protein
VESIDANLRVLGDEAVYAFGGSSRRIGSLDGRNLSSSGAKRMLKLTRERAGGDGRNQGEQNRHWSSGCAVVRRLGDAGVRETWSATASVAAEFIGAHISTLSKSE